MKGSSLSFLSSSLLAVAAFSLPCFASGKDGQQILVGLWHPSASEGARVCSSVGTVVGTDRDSDMIVVELKSGISEANAEKALKTNPAVRFVLPESARRPGRSSYNSVDQFLTYLQDSDAMKGKTDQDDQVQLKNGKQVHREGKGDFFQALRYYLRGRMNGAGYFDQNALSQAYAQKAQMPIGQIGGVSNRPAVPSSPWTFIGPKNLNIPYNIYYGTPPLSGRIAAIAYDPTNSNIIYAGSGGGGLFKSTDGGSTWTCLSDNAAWKYEATDAIAVDPKNPNIVFAGTGDFDGFFAGYNQGVMRSTDGGTTWTNVTPNISGISDVSVSKLVIDPDNDQIITITTGRGSYGGPNAGSGGIYRSTDGGNSWAAASGFTPSDYCALDISVKSGGSRTYWALGAGTPGLMYKSTDQGATWTKVSPPDTIGQGQWTLACSKVNANTVYVMSIYSQAIYRTQDGGNTWTNITSGLPSGGGYNWSQAVYDYFLGTVAEPKAPSGELLFCGLITVAYSEDGGDSWVDYGLTYGGESFSSTAVMHNDQHQFAASPSDAGQVLVGNDGGLSKLSFSWNGTTPEISLTQLNANLGITQFYNIAPHPTDPNEIVGGAQDNAGPGALGDLNNWQNPGEGDGGWYAWDIPQQVFLGGVDGGAIEVWSLSGTDLGTLSGGFSGGFIQPMVTSPDGSVIYDGGVDLNVFNLNTSNPAWVDEGVNLGDGGYITYLSTWTGDNNRLYIGNTGGQVYMSKNLGVSYTELDKNLPHQPVGAVQADPSGENAVLVGFQSLGTGISHLWLCTDVTKATPVWTSVSGSGSTGLPDVPVNGIVFDPYQPNRVWYVATDIGVFMTVNAGATWSIASTGLPGVPVFDLKTGAGYLYAGTFGRGAYRIPLVTPGTLESVSVLPVIVQGGQTATGTFTYSGVSQGAAYYTLLSSSSSVAAVPGFVQSPASATSGTFSVTTQPVAATTNVTISASAFGVTKTANLVVVAQVGPPLTNFYLSAPSVVGGNSFRGVVQITKPAPTGGSIAGFSTSNAAVSLPQTQTIPAGTTGISFAISSSPVSAPTPVTITAISGGVTKQATVTVNPAPLLRTYTSASAVLSSKSLTGVVQLGGEAGASGDVVSLASSSSAAAVPSTVTVPSGTTGASYSISTGAVTNATTVTITASFSGSKVTASFVVEPNLKNFFVSPVSAIGGTTISGVVQLAGDAGTGGQTVTLSSPSTLVTLPSSISVPAGSSGVSFKVTTEGVSLSETVTMTATQGTVTLKTTLTLTPPPLGNFYANPTSFSNSSLGTVVLSGTGGPNGDVVSLSSSSSSVTVPSTMTIAAGATSGTFKITANPVSANQNVTLTATFGASSKQTTVTLTPPMLSNFYTSPASVKGGATTTGVIQLVSEANAGGLVVSLTSSDSHVTVPATVTVPNWTTGVSFSIATAAVTTNTTVTLTAKTGNSTKTTTVTLTP